MRRAILHRIYLRGYAGWLAPRCLRRLGARSAPHRAWLAGYLGCFEEDGIRRGPSDWPTRLAGLGRRRGAT